MNPDVVIVGGGVIGSSTAYHLIKRDPGLSVMVIERDSSYEHASTVLSDGNVRVQFDLEENIRISQHTLKILETFSEDMSTDRFTPEVAARRQGNLFTCNNDGLKATLAGMAIQRGLGCRVEWLDSEEIARRYEPYRSNLLSGGTLGTDDGSVDPTSVLRGYRAKATSLGVEYVEASVLDLLVSDRAMTGVTLESGDVINSDRIVVTAGAWTSELLAGIGITLPVRPIMRTVYVVTTPFQSEGLPSIFLPGGIYAISESENVWLMGWSRPEDPMGFEFTPASRQRFDDLIWPGLVEYLPAFDRIQIERSWAGLYAVNTLDHNAIVGAWPGFEGLYTATGFSGHGFQQAPAMGRYLCETVLDLPHELDLTRLGPERIIRDEPLLEHAARVI